MLAPLMRVLVWGAMILTITLNPSVDRAIYLEKLMLHDTNRVVRTATDAGGKGINLSRVADELGAKTVATGFLGGGPGAYVRSVLDRERVRHEFVDIEGDTRINVSVEDESREPPTTFNERGPEISAAEWEELIEKCRALARPNDWACLGGSIPPGLAKDAYRTLGAMMKELGCRFLLDADGEALRLGLEAKPDLIKPNSKEAERLLGMEVKTQAQALEAARKLRDQTGAEVILSQGADGAVLCCAEGAFRGETPDVEAKSTIGSGDSMLGGYLWALESGLSRAEALTWGLAAGAATATTDGSEIARQPVIELLLPRARVQKV